MVSKAIDEGLVERIKNYVANDLNSKIDPEAEGPAKIRPANVYVLRFTRLLNNWEAVATAHLYPSIYYEIIHDGSANKTVVNVLTKHTTQEAII